MKRRANMIIVISVVSFVTIAFLIGMQSYFNNKEIRLASERCYDAGGTPKLNSDFLHLNYLFACEKID